MKEEEKNTQEISQKEEKERTQDSDELLLKQIKSEMKISEDYMKNKRTKWNIQMNLMDNIKLNDEKIGDETMWTIFNTVQSSLDRDKMTHEFSPTEKGDDEIAELLTTLADIDYKKTLMEDVERFWTYWALFCGRAVVDESEFSEEYLCILPKVIIPYLEFPDPKALCMHGYGVNGDFSARWYGYELFTSKGVLDKMGITIEGKTEKTQGMKDMEQGTTVSVTEAFGENADSSILVWYTHFEGKKYQVLVDTKISKVYRKRIIKKFPLSDRATNISPKSWHPRSIPDLLEDKHRGRANILNSTIDIVREQIKPIYLAKEGSVRLDQLERAEAGDIIEVENINDIKPMQKQSVAQDVDWILSVLDSSAQEVSATPDIQQGVIMDQQRTASELNLVASGAKNRYGMTARIFGGSMRIHWTLWYEAMMQNWDDQVHKKNIRISGVYGPEWRTIRKRDITLAGNLDVSIESKKISEQESLIQRNSFIEFHKIASTDPNYDIREGIKHIAKLSGINKQMLNYLMRKTTDELEAEEENIILAENKLMKGKKAVKFHIRQDHDAHIREHMKLDISIPAVKKHLELHYEAKIFSKNNPDIMDMMGMNMTGQEQANMNMQDQSIQDMTNTSKNALGRPTL